MTFQKARCAVLSVRRQLLTTKLSCFFNSQSAYESRNVGLGFFEGSSCDTTPMPRLCGQQIKGGHSGWGGRDPCGLSWTLRRPFLCYLGTRCLAAAIHRVSIDRHEFREHKTKVDSKVSGMHACQKGQHLCTCSLYAWL